MIQLYYHELSGNCHKARLMLSLLGLEHELVPVDLMSGEQKSPQFLKLKTLGQVPVLTDDDVVIWDAQAILVYLAQRYGGEDWLPESAELMSKVVQWLSMAANEIQQGLAKARWQVLFKVETDLGLAQKKAHQVLQILDEHLAQRPWLECDRPTIADVACYSYVGLAGDGKVSLEAYPHARAWINRIKQLPGYIGMPGL